MKTIASLWAALPALVKAVLTSFAVSLLAGITSVAIFASMQFHPEIPWAFPATLILLAAFWFVMTGGVGPASARAWARHVTRQGTMPPPVRRAAITAVLLSIALVAVFRLLLPSLLPVAPPGLKIDLATYAPVVVFGILMSVAVVAGVTEEVVFRGYLQKQLEDAYGLLPALLITGFFFWLPHFDTVSVTNMPYHMLASIVTGLLAYLTRSLWPAIIVHTTVDVVALPIYAWRQPTIAWDALSARPIYDEGATALEKLRAIAEALQPDRFASGDPFAVLTWAFLALLLLTVVAFWRLAKAARVHP